MSLQLPSGSIVYVNVDGVDKRSNLNKDDLLKAVKNIRNYSEEVGSAISHYIKNILWVLDTFEQGNLSYSEDLEREINLYKRSTYKVLVGTEPEEFIKMFRGNLAKNTDYRDNPNFIITDEMIEKFFSQFM